MRTEKLESLCWYEPNSLSVIDHSTELRLSRLYELYHPQRIVRNSSEKFTRVLLLEIYEKQKYMVTPLLVARHAF